MNMFRALAGMTLFVIISGFGIIDSPAWGQPQIGDRRMAAPITAKEAAALEGSLSKNPDNLSTREQLIRYYFEAAITDRTPEVEEKREQHIFWLIEHHPGSELAGSPETGIMAMDFAGSSEGYQHGKQLWLAQVEKNSANQRILRNAAEFLTLSDGKIAQELLEKAAALDPNDTETSSRLARSYEQQRMFASSLTEKAALAKKALSAEERGLQNADTETRFYELADAAMFALEAGEAAKAQQFASELLQDAEKFHDNWNYGNAVHKGNIVLGRVALQQGNIAGAKEHLLAAGNTPGSPQLDSFGPNVTLARELLEKGEREAVIAYLQSCGKFWKMGGDSLRGWVATVKAGGTPEFGGNLLY